MALLNFPNSGGSAQGPLFGIEIHHWIVVNVDVRRTVHNACSNGAQVTSSVASGARIRREKAHLWAVTLQVTLVASARWPKPGRARLLGQRPCFLAGTRVRIRRQHRVVRVIGVVSLLTVVLTGTHRLRRAVRVDCIVHFTFVLQRRQLESCVIRLVDIASEVLPSKHQLIRLLSIAVGLAAIVGLPLLILVARGLSRLATGWSPIHVTVLNCRVVSHSC